MNDRDWIAWCGILTTALAALLLSACDLITSPDLAGETFPACGTYPAVYVGNTMTEGQAEDFYAELIENKLATTKTGRRVLRNTQDKRVTFFALGQPLTYVRASERYHELVTVSTETDRMVTLEDELQGLVGPC